MCLVSLPAVRTPEVGPPHSIDHLQGHEGESKDTGSEECRVSV